MGSAGTGGVCVRADVADVAAAGAASLVRHGHQLLLEWRDGEHRHAVQLLHHLLLVQLQLLLWVLLMLLQQVP